MIAVLVICIVLLIYNFDLPERNNVANDAGVTSIIVAEVTPAEPVVEQTNLFPDPEQQPIHPDQEMVEDSPSYGSDEGEPNAEEVVAASPNGDGGAKGLVTEKMEKLEQRNTELNDMKSMLVLLEERNDDQERIELYKQLIAKTEKEIGDIEKDIDRYSGVSKE